MSIAPSEVIPARVDTRVVAGVDTHKDTHHVAILSTTGARLGDPQVPATASGYEQLLAFTTTFGTIDLMGVEGTNSYGAGLARFLTLSGTPNREVIRPKRAQRRRGKSDPIDAYAAAGQALADGDGLAIAKTSNGPVEQTRVLIAVRRSAMKARVAAARQIKSLLITTPEPLRTRWATLDGDSLIDALAATRPGIGTDTITTTTGHALRRLARRHHALTEEIAEIDADLRTLVTDIAPVMLATKGYGVNTTATPLVTAGDNPDRLTSNASFAAVCGAAPSPPALGRPTGTGSTAAATDRRTGRYIRSRSRASVATREHAPTPPDFAHGKSTKDVLRCLTRAIVREA